LTFVVKGWDAKKITDIHKSKKRESLDLHKCSIRSTAPPPDVHTPHKQHHCPDGCALLWQEEGLRRMFFFPLFLVLLDRSRAKQSCPTAPPPPLPDVSVGTWMGRERE
jgi:hypothetical protein